MHAPSEEKSEESKDSFYGELEQVFDHFPKYHMEILMQKWGERLFSNHFARNLDLLDLLPNILTLSHYQNIY